MSSRTIWFQKRKLAPNEKRGEKKVEKQSQEDQMTPKCLGDI